MKGRGKEALEKERDGRRMKRGEGVSRERRKRRGKEDGGRER